MPSPEAQLLALTARRTPPDDGASRLLESNLDWAKLASLAQQEGAAALVWQWLLPANGGHVPRDLAARWQKLAMVSEFHARNLERLLHEVLDLLDGAGIEVMLLKGSALAYTAYPSFAARPMSDLDLLVRPERAAEAWSLLRARGWTWPEGRWPAARYAAHQHLPPLLSAPYAAGGARLEIHAALFPDGHPFQWPVETVWMRATRLQVNGRPVLVPSALHQLLHVCIHFAWAHEMRWGSWRTFRDVEVLSRAPDIGWTQLVAAARTARAATCCYWTLRLARNIAGARVPDDVLRALRPPRPEFVVRRLERHYTLQLFSAEAGCPSEALKNALWELGIAPRWSGHGAARPWQDVERWLPDGPPSAAGWPSRLLNRIRHAGATIGYLGRITASRSLRPA